MLHALWLPEITIRQGHVTIMGEITIRQAQDVTMLHALWLEK
jgi:hypothetical protein